jgi:hypothetical protein
MLGIRHPLRWIVGAAVAIPVATIAAHWLGRLLSVAWLARAPSRAAASLVDGRFGLETLLTLKTWSLDRRVTLATGEGLHAWTAIPDVGAWRVAALLWTGAGLLALLAAAYRQRERRRA